MYLCLMIRSTVRTVNDVTEVAVTIEKMMGASYNSPKAFFNINYGPHCRFNLFLNLNIPNRYLLRLEFQVAHQILSSALATDQK